MSKNEVDGPAIMMEDLVQADVYSMSIPFGHVRLRAMSVEIQNVEWPFDWVEMLEIYG